MKIVTGVRCVARSPETIRDTIESLNGAGFFDLVFFVDGRFPKIAKLEEIKGSGVFDCFGSSFLIKDA